MSFAVDILHAQTVTPSYTPPPAFDPWLANAFYAAGLLTAGDRHLGADDVVRRRRAGGQLREGRLGSRAELRGA